VQGTLLADSRWWTIVPDRQADGTSQHHHHRSTSGSGGGSRLGEAPQLLVPCISAGLQDAGLCLQMMQYTDDMHLNIHAADTEWLDLRASSSATSNISASSAARTRSDPAAVAAESTQCAADDAGSTWSSEPAAAGKVRWSVPGKGDAAAAGSRRYPTRSLSPFAADQWEADGDVGGSPSRIGTAAAAGTPPRMVRMASVGVGAGTPVPPRLTDLGQLSAASRQRGATADAHSLAPAAATTGADDGDNDEDAVAAAAEGQQLQDGDLEPAVRGVSPNGVTSEGGGGDQQLGSFELYPALLQPSAAGPDRGPDIAIIRVLDELPADESAHLRSKGKRAAARRGIDGGGGSSNPAAAAVFKFYLGSLAEGTMAIEVRGWMCAVVQRP
jgi:hypothetical protein